jgi:branched-chain amino acid transport system substrate-binding protein
MSGAATRRLLIGTLVAAVGLAGCGGDGDGGGAASAGDSDEPIVVGGVMHLTGQFAEFGSGAQAGTRAGQAAINEAGGVLGREIELDIGDDQSDPAKAIPVANRLVADGIVAEIGGATGLLRPSEPIYTRAKIPILAPGGDVSYDDSTNKYLFRLSPSDSQAGVAIAIAAYEQGHRTAAMVFDNGPVAQQLKPVVGAAFEKLGGQVVDEIDVRFGQSSYRSEATRIAKTEADVILGEVQPNAAGVLFSDLNAVGAGDMKFVGSDATASQEFVKAVGEDKARALLTSVQQGAYESPAGDEFLKFYGEIEDGQPLAGASFTYDGMVLLGLAIALAESTDGDAIVDALEKLGDGEGTEVTSFQAGIDAIEAGEEIEYNGASGPLDFDEHHNVSGAFAAVQLNDKGEFDKVQDITPEQVTEASGT